MPHSSRQKPLAHQPPPWVSDGSLYFVTICCTDRGKPTLTKPDIATAILDSLRFRVQSEHWWIGLFLLMPDHAHGLISVSLDHSLQREIESWKRFLARQHEIRWQPRFFDHRIRDNRSFHEKWDYISNNPVRAKLIEEAGAWPFRWTMEDLKKRDQ